MKEEGNVKIVAVKIDKRLLQVELSGANLIMNNFGIVPKVDILIDHLTDKGIKAGKKIRSPKTLDSEVFGHVEFDHKGRIAFLSRHIMAALVDAFNISVTEQDNKRKNPKSFRKCVRVEGLEEQHFCPIEFKDYRTRVDSVVLTNGMSSVAVRPEFIDWKIRCNIIFHQDIIDEASVCNIVARAGDCVGLGAWTPQYSGSFGLFTVKVLKFIKTDPTKRTAFDKRLIDKGLGLFLKENADKASSASMIARLRALKVAA